MSVRQFVSLLVSQSATGVTIMQLGGNEIAS